MSTDVTRMPLVDALKAIACLLIVLHHLSVYGPMATAAYPLFPDLITWLYQYGRIVVQAFIVIAGFLTARKFALRGGSLLTGPVHVITQRYLRLVVPYVSALLLAIICAALARALHNHEAIPKAAEIFQFLAHLLLLQDLLNQEALSAGIWYITIDFQLFALTVLLLWLPQQFGYSLPNVQLGSTFLIACLTAVSLFIFNRDAFWDETAFYFFGSYGLGFLSYSLSNNHYGTLWLAMLGVLVAIALLVEFRYRIAVAGVLMLILGLARQTGILESCAMPRFISYLGRISFSIFLVHFPLLLLVNAAFSVLFPNHPVANAYGLLLALCISVMGGALFYKWIESRPVLHRLTLFRPKPGS